MPEQSQDSEVNPIGGILTFVFMVIPLALVVLFFLTMLGLIFVVLFAS